MEKKAQGADITKEVTTLAYFMCCGCGYLVKLDLESNVPPHECPACGQTCAFVNVTSYRPEFGAEGNPDTKIMALLLDAAEAQKKERAGVAQRTQGLMSSRTYALCREAALIALRESLEQKRKAGLLRVREPVARERGAA